MISVLKTYIILFIKGVQEGKFLGDMDQNTSGWNRTYKDLEQIVGVEATIKIYKEYRGMQLNLPVRLFSRDYLTQRLAIEYNGLNKRELAKKYGYSQRTIERMLREIKNKNISDQEEI